MTVQSGPYWNYPVGSMATSSDAVSFTTVGLPASPTSITTTAMSSPLPDASLPSLTPDVVPQSSNRNRGRRHHSKLSTPSSSLPNPKELSIEDDWTRVKCPKEKKRIQNRVAQRTYRHRMKARLGELQARLDSHERQKMSQIAHGPSEVPNSEGSSSGQTNLYTVHGPANSYPSSQGPNGLLSPPGLAEFEQSSHVSQDFVLDCVRFEGQLVHRLGTAEHDASYSRQTQYGSPNSSLPQVMGSISRDHLGCMSSLPSNLDYSFDGSRDDDWRTDAFGLETRSCPSPMGHMSFSQISDHAAIRAPEPLLWKDDGSCSTEERVDSVMRYARDNGFETFEDFATSYYKIHFSKSPRLSAEQNLSLATILLQRCSGTMSRERLVRVVEACI